MGNFRLERQRILKTQEQKRNWLKSVLNHEVNKIRTLQEWQERVIDETADAAESKRRTVQRARDSCDRQKQLLREDEFDLVQRKKAALNERQVKADSQQVKDLSRMNKLAKQRMESQLAHDEKVRKNYAHRTQVRKTCKSQELERQSRVEAIDKQERELHEKRLALQHAKCQEESSRQSLQRTVKRKTVQDKANRIEEERRCLIANQVQKKTERWTGHCGL